ncbi:hypothetical protein [Ruegeria arenilitoris]|uniref:hypothetical protein n=1 Tax=Ruegeria arenilitoris TaxID=1173585 RepID=UPI00147AC627|nr:hypothetical protein [Ruegeria arenilitoris]
MAQADTSAVEDCVSAEGIRCETQFAKTIAMGDIVRVHSKMTDLSVEGDLSIGYMDIFRFNDEGLIVEPWDIEEAKTGESANENDMLGYPAE